MNMFVKTHAKRFLFLKYFTLQNDETESFSTCCICHTRASTEDEGKIRMFSNTTWTTIKHVADMRKKFKTDKYVEVTQKILVSSEQETPTLNYHPSCYKCYTAMKRQRETLPSDDEPAVATKKACIETRRCSVLPKSNQQGLLKGSCIFCGKSRKKRNGKEEPRLKVSTVVGCESLCQRVNKSN